MKLSPWKIVVSLAATAMALTGCSGWGFSSAYRKSLGEYQASPSPSGVEGPWEGYWESDSNGHTGKLRAIISSPEDPDQPNAYPTRYHATWAKVLSGGYTVDTEITPASPGAYTAISEKELGVLGSYRSEGRIEGASFDSRYTSKADNGKFVLKRPVVGE